MAMHEDARGNFRLNGVSLRRDEMPLQDFSKTPTQQLPYPCKSFQYLLGARELILNIILGLSYITTSTPDPPSVAIGLTTREGVDARQQIDCEAGGYEGKLLRLLPQTYLHPVLVASHRPISRQQRSVDPLLSNSTSTCTSSSSSSTPRCPARSIAGAEPEIAHATTQDLTPPTALVFPFVSKLFGQPPTRHNPKPDPKHLPELYLPPARAVASTTALVRDRRPQLSLSPPWSARQGKHINAIMASWAGQPSIKGGSETLRMILLTFSTIGFTSLASLRIRSSLLIISTPLRGRITDCTPYLLNLGLTKSNTSLVWIAGPLSGLIVQPIVGVLADESTSRWGRRRPLMVIGAAIVAITLLVLGFTREVVGLVIQDDEAAKRPTIVLAVLSIYVLDFAINAVMSCSRSLIVDTLPIDKQQTGAAWSSRMSAVGNMIAYACGSIDLLSIFGTTFGDTQFKQLTVLATAVLIGSTALTCWAVGERVLVSPRTSKKNGLLGLFRQIYRTLLNLPPRVQAICWAQFWSWIGWFPFLFYSTTWVGETYFRYDLPAGAEKSKDALGDIGRIGSTALTLYSIVTFVAAFTLPLLVKSPDDEGFTQRPPQAVTGYLQRFATLKPDLLTTWVFGQLLFAAAMSLAPFATSFKFATILVCLCGLPWSIALWAPTAFLGVEVNKLSASGHSTAPYRRLSTGSDTELRDFAADDTSVPAQHESEDANATSSTGELSGIYFGILNVYTTLPQFVGTFISMIVFAILEPGKSPELATDAHPDEHAGTGGPNAIAVCLFIGAMSSIVGSIVTRRMRAL
ncbi:alpha-glucoside permease [Paramyrothecium foliicola]|nr:alpha-glucoside permease [Paramyrothecium foliicola]